MLPEIDATVSEYHALADTVKPLGQSSMAFILCHRGAETQSF
jgi:hypothetical protein